MPREKAKSTGISSLTLRKVTRWSPRLRAAISPKSSSGGSTTSAATTARACTGRRNGFTGGPFLSASNETIARSFTSRVEAFVKCRASVARISRWSPYRSFPACVAVDLNPFAALSFVERASDGGVGFIVNVTRRFSYGSNAPSDGTTASVARSGRSALSSARSFTANRVGYGELLYTAPLTERVSPQSTCPKSTARIGNGSASAASVRNSGARGKTVAVAQIRADDDCDAFATFFLSAEVVATSTSTETSPGSFGFKNAVTSTDFPGSTVANLGSTRNTSRSTRRSQLHSIRAAAEPALRTETILVSASPGETTPKSKSPSTAVCGAGARAARRTSVSPASVWITHASKKSLASSVVNVTSNEVVRPGESRVVVTPRFPANANRDVLGGITFTTCGRLSALRSVTVAVYVVFASTCANVTAGGKTRSHGSGSGPCADVRFSNPRKRALIASVGQSNQTALSDRASSR